MSVDIIREYFSKVEEIHKTGVATEHSYRASLEWLFDKIEIGVTAVNEPKGVKVGRPDFVFQRGVDQITVGHCEAKDINLDVSPKAMDKGNKAQFERYVKGLPNLIYTNCLDFHFYKNGELVREIKIADYIMGLQADESQFEPLWNQLRDFTAERLQTITSAERLAEVMAGKAAIIKDVLFNSLGEDEDLQSELAGQYKAFKDQLIHDLEIEGFSDIYAETIAYGLFAARLHDEDLETFSRAEALEKLPKSNPFLRKLFEFVAGPGLDDAIKRTIDELAEIFQAVDLGKLFENFGTFTQRNDPFIHFYETFLAKYNPAKRKARGVWYTPEPVVNFIVRAVDDVLKEEFGLADGLADTSKITVDFDTGESDKKGKPITRKEEMHRVQILDPAAGTGTFLAEVIKQISDKIKAVAPGQLSSYIEKDLIPRLHGFELLMASYAMCHMKLDMMLTSLGYKPTKEPPRLGVYLTNSLEEGVREVPDLFMARWLSDEARLANNVKRDKPIMCVIGNPPYSVSSSNKSPWIENLVADYKKDLNERNIQPLSDDYIKFIRFAHHMIEKNGEGILGFITNNSYLDGLIHRQMRKSLLESFDKIYVIDLHGNSNKGEVAPDGSIDKNVFDIQQGVSIIIAVKNKTAKQSDVFHSDLWGSRKTKYEILKTKKIYKSSKILPIKPSFYFITKNFDDLVKYENGFSLLSLLSKNAAGLVSGRDKILICLDNKKAKNVLNDFINLNELEFKRKHALTNDSRDWKFDYAKKESINAKVQSISYRPLDIRYLPYSENSKGILQYPRHKIMKHMLRENIGLAFNRQVETDRNFYDAFLTSNLFDKHGLSLKENNNFAPLYLYPDEQDLDQSIRVNMDGKIRAEIEACAMGRDVDSLLLVGRQLSQGAAAGETVGVPQADMETNVDGVTPTRSDHPSDDQSRASPQGGGEQPNIQPIKDVDGRPNEVAIFDYIYGVLHAPNYRETYKEFLKIDFPRIPYPPSPDVFWDVAEKGGRLRQLHLMEDQAIGDTPYLFEGEGDSLVGKVHFEGTSVFINETQYFKDVPQIAWEFYIGGYQPAQKWLKDRKGRELSFDDIRHYQKIIKILSETDAIMKTIEMPLD